MNEDEIRSRLLAMVKDLAPPTDLAGQVLRSSRRRRVSIGALVPLCLVAAVWGTGAVLADSSRNVPPSPDGGVTSEGLQRHRCPTGWMRHENGRGDLSICTPPNWTFQNEAAAGLVSPAVEFAVGSWRFKPGGGCAPTKALRHVPPDGAFFYGFEYQSNNARTSTNFPRRPSHFKLGELGGPFECLGVRTYLILFRQNDRYFQVHVKLGHSADSKVRRLVLRSLDSIELMQ
jgi:hypothetical protein